MIRISMIKIATKKRKLKVLKNSVIFMYILKFIERFLAPFIPGKHSGKLLLEDLSNERCRTVSYP